MLFSGGLEKFGATASVGAHIRPKGPKLESPGRSPGLLSPQIFSSPEGAQLARTSRVLRPVGACRGLLSPQPRAAPWAIESGPVGATKRIIRRTANGASFLGGAGRGTHRFSLRLGMTLVELLMVLVIVVILIAVIAPLTRIGTQDRKLREAARQINAYLAGAQARAAERGRPVFVQFVRQENACVRMGLAEVPPPYTGDITDAVVSSITGTGPWTVNFRTGDVTNLKSRKLVLGVAGEAVRFNYQGHLFPILDAGETTLLITTPLNSITGPPPVVGEKGLPFQIYRAPIASSAAPLTLPVGTAIDLSVSGGGTTGTQFSLATNDVTPVQIGFAPSGGVSGVLYSNTYMVSQAVHLLIGRIDRLGLQNLKDSEAIWISVNPTTGVCTTTDNRVDPTVASPTVDYARTYATASQNLGGR